MFAEVTKRAVEVWDKTCLTTTSISIVVSEEAKDGLVGNDRFEGVAARRGGALFYSCMNFCGLWQTEISWPLAQQNSLWVPLEDWEVGRPKVNLGAAMGGCGGGESVASTWPEDDMWKVGQWFSLELSSLTVASREGVGD